MAPAVVRHVAQRLYRALPSAARTLVDKREWYGYQIAGAIAAPMLAAYRPLLRRVAFIGVTGSCGKSTTKELIAGVLATRHAGSHSVSSFNQPWRLAVFLLRARPWHRYSVQEIGVGLRGEPWIFERSLALVRPSIGIVTNVGSDHVSAFGSIDAIAAQKGRLVEALPAHGLAILNADDPRVLAMRSRTRARVLTVGASAHADLRAEDVSSRWPARLTFTVVRGEERQAVRTQLCGEHWVFSALAAIAVACEVGMTLADAAAALERVPPFRERMSPIARDDGVTFVRDDSKGSMATVEPALRFMRDADATRKWVVVGTLADYVGSSTRAYVEVARDALAAADRVVFVGSRANKSAGAAKGADRARLHAFVSLDAACAMLRRELRAGDLVLLKGNVGSGLGRILTDARTDAAEPASMPADCSDMPAATAWAVIGLGNPGDAHEGTPHNVGYVAADRLAARLGLAWRDDPDAQVASGMFEGSVVHVVKPRVPMNTAGPVVAALARRLGFDAARMLLLHDEMELPLGRVRGREEGGDGGHRGVRSVHVALGTPAIARVKIGVGRPRDGGDGRAFVLSALDASGQATIANAADEAAQRALAMIHDREARRPPITAAAGGPAGTPSPADAAGDAVSDASPPRAPLPS